MKPTSAVILCLTDASPDQLALVYDKVRDGYSSVGLWTLSPDKDLAEWARQNNIAYRILDTASRVLFLTPRPDIRLEMTADLLKPCDYFFVCRAAISKDNYLKGAVFSLSRLLPAGSITELDFPGYLFELYMYFRDSAFFVFYGASNAVLADTAWTIDSYLIRRHKLKKNRAYNVFYKYLKTPVVHSFSENAGSLPAEDTVLYENHIFRNAVKKAKNLNAVMVGSFIILKTVLSFRIKKYREHKKKRYAG